MMFAGASFGWSMFFAGVVGADVMDTKSDEYFIYGVYNNNLERPVKACRRMSGGGYVYLIRLFFFMCI